VKNDPVIVKEVFRNNEMIIPESLIGHSGVIGKWYRSYSVIIC